jgi:hypothetical protein
MNGVLLSRRLMSFVAPLCCRNETVSRMRNPAVYGWVTDGRPVILSANRYLDSRSYLDSFDG